MQQLRIAVLSNTAEINTEEDRGVYINGKARIVYGFSGDDLQVLKDLAYRLSGLEESVNVAQFFDDIHKISQDKLWKEENK